MFTIEIAGLGTATLLVIVGLGLLLFAGDLLVKGAVSLAVRFHIPPIIIGLTIIAFGTSAPELFIGIESVYSGNTGIALGNVVGSNIANILLVLGIPSMIYPTQVNQPSIRRNTLIMISASVLFIWMAQKGSIEMQDGIILFFLIAMFLAYSATRALNSPGADPTADELADVQAISGLPQTGLIIAAFLLFGLIGLQVGAKFMVDGGVYVAEGLGIDKTVIGLSMIAFGTSLPELATTVVAAMRRHSDLAIGNVIGSNIFNILAVMGITAIVAGDAGIPVPTTVLGFDLWIMLATGSLLLPFALFHRSITRPMGAAFLIAYGIYIYYIYAQSLI